jgi:hypothetical protein
MISIEQRNVELVKWFKKWVDFAKSSNTPPSSDMWDVLNLRVGMLPQCYPYLRSHPSTPPTDRHHQNCSTPQPCQQDCIVQSALLLAEISLFNPNCCSTWLAGLPKLDM